MDSNQNNANPVNLEIVELNSYYPYGMTMEYENNLVSSYSNSVARKFKYNGIEHEEALGLDLYEMDVRHYDAAIARWTGIDPVTHHSMSTYMAFDGNPVYWTDPSGADAESVGEWNERVNAEFDALENGASLSDVWGLGSVIKENKIKDKKYRLMTTVSRSGYVNFTPDKTGNGNDLDVGVQTIIERVEILNKYYIKHDTGKAEFLFVRTIYELRTDISYDGKEITSTMTTMESSGDSLQDMKETCVDDFDVEFNDLNSGHQMVANKIIDELDESGKPLAVAHRDLALDITGYSGGYGVYDLIKEIVKTGKFSPSPVSGSLVLTHLSIRFTPAKDMRLILYNQNLRFPGNIFKPIDE